MPIYEYSCEKCEKSFEKLIFGSEAVTCPTCGGEVGRLMSTCCFRSGAGDFKSAATSGSSCTGCSATSCATCH